MQLPQVRACAWTAMPSRRGGRAVHAELLEPCGVLATGCGRAGLRQHRSQLLVCTPPPCPSTESRATLQARHCAWRLRAPIDGRMVHRSEDARAVLVPTGICRCLPSRRRLPSTHSNRAVRNCRSTWISACRVLRDCYQRAVVGECMAARLASDQPTARFQRAGAR